MRLICPYFVLIHRAGIGCGAKFFTKSNKVRDSLPNICDSSFIFRTFRRVASLRGFVPKSGDIQFNVNKRFRFPPVRFPGHKSKPGMEFQRKPLEPNVQIHPPLFLNP